VSRTEAPTERLPAGGPRSAPRDDERTGGRLVLDRYRLLEQLGVGAFGTVWRARDERLEREVAVKAIPAAGEHVASGRAEREARAAARLAHPAIVTLYEAGADEHAMYLVSELVHGATLARLLADGALSDRDVAEVGLALCQALAHAHAQGVVHRDVKPSNVLVPDATHAGGPAAKLTDFGIARLLAGAGDELLTRTGDVVGTLAYMAPEQAEGREAGPEADLYAAALVLYEALSGTNPLRAGSAVATARRLGATLPPLRRQRRDLPQALCQGIDQALAPRPTDRGTIADLHRALRATAPDLDDEPGTIAAPTIDRVTTAVTQAANRGREGWRRRSRDQELADVAAELGAEDWTHGGKAAQRRPRDQELNAIAAELGAAADWTHRRPADSRHATAGQAETADHPGAAGWSAPDDDRRRGSVPAAPPANATERVGTLPRRHTQPPAPLLAGHIAPGLAAGGLVALVLALAGKSGDPSPLLTGALAAAAVGLLPRIGWIVAAAVLTGWLAGEGGLAGTALLLGCAVVAIPPLLPRAGRAWSLPFAAPIMGIAMLAGAYPALAGQARTPWRRAALGALGFWALALAEPVLHATLFYGRARGTLPPSAWQDSAPDAWRDAVEPLLRSGALACAGLWAAGALVLPWLVRGRSAALDLVAATMWAAGLAAGAAAIGHALGGKVPSPDPRGAAFGAAIAVLLAVAARGARVALGGRRGSDEQALA
jgi:eukaryotic-like serine/threonine-protein kinase